MLHHDSNELFTEIFSDKNQDKNQIDNQDTAATGHVESHPGLIPFKNTISNDTCDDNQGYQHKDNT
jgi:hypothetical protein